MEAALHWSEKAAEDDKEMGGEQGEGWGRES
jgi:hypothetical protein